jgi:hypothetical protein
MMQIFVDWQKTIDDHPAFHRRNLRIISLTFLVVLRALRVYTLFAAPRNEIQTAERHHQKKDRIQHGEYAKYFYPPVG